MLCVFDCETIPDVDLLKELYDYRGSDLEVCELAFSEQEKVSGSSFLPLPFHKIISLSALICDEFGNFVKLGNFAQEDENRGEKEILDKFISYLNKNNPRLVSFNGRTFDLPLIMLRAMKYNLSAESYFEVDNKALNKSKWSNYRTRYAEDFHLDLMDSISSFNFSRGLRLDILCKMLEIPGKFEVDGGDVYKIFYEQKNLKKIDEYCQSDVLNTYWLFLKYQILQGKITKFQYAEMLEIFLDKIPRDKSYSQTFESHLKTEIKSLKD